MIGSSKTRLLFALALAGTLYADVGFRAADAFGSLKGLEATYETMGPDGKKASVGALVGACQSLGYMFSKQIIMALEASTNLSADQKHQRDEFVRFVQGALTQAGSPSMKTLFFGIEAGDFQEVFSTVKKFARGEKDFFIKVRTGQQSLLGGGGETQVFADFAKNRTPAQVARWHQLKALGDLFTNHAACTSGSLGTTLYSNNGTESLIDLLLRADAIMNGTSLTNAIVISKAAQKQCGLSTTGRAWISVIGDKLLGIGQLGLFGDDDHAGLWYTASGVALAAWGIWAFVISDLGTFGHLASPQLLPLAVGSLVVVACYMPTYGSKILSIAAAGYVLMIGAGYFGLIDLESGIMSGLGVGDNALVWIGFTSAMQANATPLKYFVTSGVNTLVKNHGF